MKGLVKAATALAVMLAMSGAMAQAPQVGTQAPGYFRLAVGDYEVTALFDGYNDCRRSCCRA